MFEVNQGIIQVSYIIATILFILALGGLSNQETARRGNWYGIVGMAIALVATLVGDVTQNFGLLIVALLIGGSVGLIAARRVQMTQMPELVAILHSLVGLAAIVALLLSGLLLVRFDFFSVRSPAVREIAYWVHVIAPFLVAWLFLALRARSLRLLASFALPALGLGVIGVIYESRPGFHVTAILYLPESKPPYPGVLLPCGHSANGKAAGAYQRASILLAKNGIAVLCYDPIGQGERKQLLEKDGKGRWLPKGRFGPTGEHMLEGVAPIPLGQNLALHPPLQKVQGKNRLP